MVKFQGILGFAAALMLLGGCATGSPSASPAPESAAPSVTAAPAPEPGPPATIVIGASDVSVIDAAGAVLGTVPYADGGDAVVALLTTAVGEPDVIDGNECGPDTNYVWPDYEGLQVTASDEPPVAPYVGVVVTSKVARFDGIAIETDGGVAVGDDVSDLAASLPADQVGFNGALVWESTATATSPGGDENAFGGVIYTDGDEATAILAPGTIFSGYSC